MSTRITAFNKLQDTPQHCLEDVNWVLFYFTVLLNSYVCFILDLGLWKELPMLYLILSNVHNQQSVQNSKRETWPRRCPFRYGWLKDTAVATSAARQTFPALWLLSTWQAFVLLHWVGPSNQLWPLDCEQECYMWLPARAFDNAMQDSPEHSPLCRGDGQCSRWWLWCQPGVQREENDSTEQHSTPDNQEWIHNMSKKHTFVRMSPEISGLFAIIA